MGKKLSTDEFIRKSKEVHDDKYDYSLVEYIGSYIRVKIICNKHGVFEQIPNSHLNGNGCSYCANNNKYSTKTFTEKSRQVHGDKYDYSLVDYKQSHSKIKIICKEHGIFIQKPYIHLTGKGCKKCDNNKKSLSMNEFLLRSETIHNKKYDYSLVKYNNIYTNIDIICKKHGIFSQRPEHHMNGNGCPKCKSSKGETIIRKILEKNNIKFDVQKTFDDCKYIRKLKFDFYIHDYNICIEYDGKHHFIPINNFGGIKEFSLIKEKDEIKNKYCRDNNINLIRIKYDEDIMNKLNNLIKKQ